MKGYMRRTADERRTFAILAQQCHHSGTQELFTKFGTEPKLELSSFRGRAVSRASHDSKRSLGRFRLRALANVVCKSPCAGATPTVQAAGRLRKGRSGLGFRVGNREACVLLSVCEAQTRYS